MDAVLPIDRAGDFVRTSVSFAGGVRGRFLVDSGIGVTVVGSAFAERLGAEPTGQRFSGRRMSGQLVTADLVRLPDLRLAELVLHRPLAAVVDLGSADGPDGFDGIFGLDLLGAWAVTVDPFEMALSVSSRVLLEPADAVVPIEVRRDGVSVAAYAPLVLPSGRVVTVEVDTGSQGLILHTRHMGDVGLDLASERVEADTGIDETGFRWVRRFAEVDGPVHLEGAESTAHGPLRVMFQDIIYDGLLGSTYLDRYRYTFDLTGERLVLGQDLQRRLLTSRAG